MESLFSDKEKGVLLHVVFKKEDFSEPRVNLSPDEEYMQTCCLVFPLGREVPPHKHIESEKTTKITQETVIVIGGELEAEYYDLDNRFLKKIILKEGDCSVTFRGGHSFRAIKENTKIYEVKR